MPDRERKRVPDHRSFTERLSPPVPSCPSKEHGISEYPRLIEESKKESRDERGMEELHQ